MSSIPLVDLRAQHAAVATEVADGWPAWIRRGRPSCGGGGGRPVAVFAVVSAYHFGAAGSGSRCASDLFADEAFAPSPALSWPRPWRSHASIGYLE